MDDKFKDSLHIVNFCMNTFVQTRWFMAFDSLLYIKKRINKPCDLHICYFHNPDLIAKPQDFMPQYGFNMKKSEGKREKFYGDRGIDLFMYELKVKGKVFYTEDNPNPMKYAKEIIKQFWPYTQTEVWVPLGYGSLLDYWYGKWYLPDFKIGKPSFDIEKEL